MAKDKEPAKPLTPKERVQAFMSEINKTYDSGVVKEGGKFDALKTPRFSSGILSLDLALGGGWPFGRIGIVAGEFSTGKTLLTIKAMNEVTKFDHVTKKHRDFVKPEEFTPGTALFVDMESTFDPEWAKANGWDETAHVVARPEYSAQAIDIITKAVQDNVFDLIILDSIAAMTPSKEIEESSEDWQMGLAARENNKAFRKWVAALNKHSQNSASPGPFLLCLNQFRMKIGLMFGDPRTLPGGKGQEFAASIIMYTKSAEYDDSKDKELSQVTLSGTFRKNKTYVPKMNFAYDLGLKDSEDLKKGEVDNLKQLMVFGKKYNLIVVEGGEVRFGRNVFKTQRELRERLEASPQLYRSLWMSIVKAATGQLV